MTSVPFMHESERNRILKQQRALLLGASDMAQAIAAARALQIETDGTLARALETAMVVSFMRPFTGSLKLPAGYTPPGPEEDRFFRDLKTLRNKVYAHTDEDTGRAASPITVQVEGEIVNLSWNEAWIPLDRARLGYFIETCEELKANMHLDAGKAQLVLNGEIPLDRWSMN